MSRARNVLRDERIRARHEDAAEREAAKTGHRRVRVLKTVSVSTTSGIIRFEQFWTYSDPSLVHLIEKYDIPHEPC